MHFKVIIFLIKSSKIQPSFSEIENVLLKAIKETLKVTALCFFPPQESFPSVTSDKFTFTKINDNYLKSLAKIAQESAF